MSFRDKVQCAFRLLSLPTVMISRKLRGSLAEKNVIRLRTLRKVKEVKAVLTAESIRKLFQENLAVPLSLDSAGIPQYSYNGLLAWLKRRNVGAAQRAKEDSINIV
jgi:hypothetical protein